MRKPIAITLFLASVLGAGVAATHMMSPKGDAPVPKEEILAATMPLSTGTLLRAQDVSWQGVTAAEPNEIVRPNATALAAKPELDDQMQSSVYGAVLRHPLDAGAPIRRTDFAKPGDRDFLQVVLTQGSRAISIPVATGGASTGLLTPGDRVDVFLTQDFKDGNAPLTRRSVGEMVVENIRVLAIDAPDTKGNFGRTVTLEVTAEQTQKINVAAELGKLSLTLRSATTDPTRLAESNKPTWAGDVSPALYHAGQDTPRPIVPPPPVEVLHGTRKAESVKSD